MPYYYVTSYGAWSNTSNGYWDKISYGRLYDQWLYNAVHCIGCLNTANLLDKSFDGGKTIIKICPDCWAKLKEALCQP